MIAHRSPTVGLARTDANRFSHSRLACQASVNADGIDPGWDPLLWAVRSSATLAWWAIGGGNGEAIDAHPGSTGPFRIDQRWPHPADVILPVAPWTDPLPAPVPPPEVRRGRNVLSLGRLARFRDDPRGLPGSFQHVDASDG